MNVLSHHFQAVNGYCAAEFSCQAARHGMHRPGAVLVGIGHGKPGRQRLERSASPEATRQRKPFPSSQKGGRQCGLLK